MSVRRRRYNRDRITKVMYDSVERLEEQDCYTLIDFNEKDLDFFIDDHTDLVILYIIEFWVQKIVTKHELFKLIDIVEGYYFAYKEGLIDSENLYFKLNKYILGDMVFLEGKIGVYMEGIIIDMDE